MLYLFLPGLVLDIQRESSIGLFAHLKKSTSLLPAWLGSALLTRAVQERAAPSCSLPEISTQNFQNTQRANIQPAKTGAKRNHFHEALAGSTVAAGKDFC